MAEELLSQKQMRIINDALAVISQRHPDLYYESTETISYLIHEYFQKEGTVAQKEIVGSLSPDDIYIKLSHSK